MNWFVLFADSHAFDHVPVTSSMVSVQDSYIAVC